MTTSTCPALSMVWGAVCSSFWDTSYSRQGSHPDLPVSMCSCQRQLCRRDIRLSDLLLAQGSRQSAFIDLDACTATLTHPIGLRILHIARLRGEDDAGTQQFGSASVGSAAMALVSCHCLGNYSHPVCHPKGEFILAASALAIQMMCEGCCLFRLQSPVQTVSGKHGLQEMRSMRHHVHSSLQDVKQFYIMRFFLGAAEVRHMTSTDIVAALYSKGGVPLPSYAAITYDCMQGGTMPGMWYTLSLYFSGEGVILRYTKVLCLCVHHFNSCFCIWMQRPYAEP